MSQAMPHSAVSQQQLEAYLADLGNEVAKCRNSLPTLSEYRAVFKTSYAAYAVLIVSARRELPFLRAAAGIARRLPLLLACRQVSLAYVELRRFLESTVWFCYFREHPVECEEFLKNPSTGPLREGEKPIAQAAHHGVSWYFAYSRERFSQEASGLGSEAVDMLGRVYPELCAQVHAAYGITLGDLSNPFDRIDPATIRSYGKLQRETLMAGCLMVAASKPRGMAKLEAVERALFDWLIGRTRSRRIRSTSFGLN